MFFPRTRLLLAVCLFLLPFRAGLALAALEVSLGTIEGRGWLAEGVRLSLAGDVAYPLVLVARIERLRLPGVAEPLEKLELRCEQLRLAKARIGCAEGTLRLRHPWLDPGRIKASFDWRPDSERLDLELTGVGLAKGRLSLAAHLQGEHWKLRLRGRSLSLAGLRPLILGLSPEGLSDWQADAKLDLRLDVSGRGVLPARAQWRLDIEGLTLAGPGEQVLGEDIAARLTGSFQSSRTRVWDGDTQLVLTQGALLTPAFYLEAGAKPVTLGGRWRLDGGAQRLELRDLQVRQPEVLEASGRAGIDLGSGTLDRLSVRATDIRLDALYQADLQPVLSGTLLEQVDLKGTLDLEYEQQAGSGRHLRASLREVSIRDLAGREQDGYSRFALNGLNGILVWSRDRPAQVSTLSWSGGHLLDRILIGACGLRLKLRDQAVQLIDEARIPVFDGTLIVDRLAYGTDPDEPTRLDFDGVLTPISMDRLSNAFGWPPLAGTLSGVIPGVSLQDGVLKVDGTLLVRIFGGRVLIEGLRLTDLFGALPTLSARVELKGLDLETLTSTFSFGKITGKLEGEVEGLSLEDWKPVAFDARFATPADDDSRHRISQRAVENISNLGGSGVSGTLSRTFLGLFEDFNYDRLGIGCHLHDGVCDMGGVAPAENGYYLVTGRGLPQINIMGYNRHTDWKRLVRQLSQITAAGTPEIR